MFDTYKSNSSLQSAILILLTVILNALPLNASPQRMAGAERGPEGDTITVSLITCYPGPEIYELCGHEAIRVKTPSTDSIWNYGVFDFNEPNFVYRFVKGETDYRLAGYPFQWFLPEYIRRGSKVVEQELDFTPDQARKFRAMLQTEALPQNCKYRYNYIKDNCSTRVADRIDSIAGEPVYYPDDSRFNTWRDAMRHYHSNYPWYQFGIDLALGSGLDTEMQRRDDTFVPMILMEKARKAHFADGKPLIRGERVLYPGNDNAILPPTQWWFTPVFWSVATLALILIFCFYSLIRKRIYSWGYAVFFGLLGLTGCLSAFLVFISSHEATAPNILVLWLNPLQLVFPIFIWSRKTRPVCKAMSAVNIIMLGCLLLIWPLQNQTANPAFFPLMGATLIMSVTYAILSFHPSFNCGERIENTYNFKTPGKGTPRKRVAKKTTRKKK